MLRKIIRAAAYKSRCLIAVIAAIACTSCEKKPPMEIVHGKVVLDDKPLLTGGVITSLETGRGAQGAIKNGEFELNTFGIRDGALIGTHKIAVVAYEQNKASGPEAPVGKLIVPQRYINPETSGLTIEVTASGPNEPVLKLTSP